MRDILHCDLNSFFASVECLKNPKLKLVPMAVCGDPTLRHGIILAKNDLAKKYNIVTAETIYSAKKKCNNLVLVKCSMCDYEKYSILVRNIYLKYTDKVEPFGIDECFLDVTESTKLFGDSITIANLIKEDVKNTLGLTISVGVSFNKPLAKLR
jgi:DNA polymerase IV